MSLQSQAFKTKPRLRLAAEQFDGSQWTGGTVYMQNLFAALSTLDIEERPFTLLTRMEGAKPYDVLVDKLIEISNSHHCGNANRFYRKAVAKFGLGKRLKPPIADVLDKEDVDALFTHKIYSREVGRPLIGWIPDFQYLYYPEIAGTDGVRQFTEFHQDLIRQSNSLVVSSKDVMKDLKSFDCEAAKKAHIIPFAAQVPQDIYDQHPSSICQKYSIPERYIFLPNQFWKHKNHLLVVKALHILAERSVDLTIVSTGLINDSRNPEFCSVLQTSIARAGVHDRFRMLGLVPRGDVFRLLRQAKAVLQPSLFEGWSTSIEEAKSLGKRVVASDLDVHLEQAPDAVFFLRNNAESLANCLEQVARDTLAGPDLGREAVARAVYPGRVKEFAYKFLSVVSQASADR